MTNSEGRTYLNCDCPYDPEHWFCPIHGWTRAGKDPEGAECCDLCGKPIPVGGWPFCASPRNPQGHARGGAYAWSMGSPIRKWTRDPKLGRG